MATETGTLKIRLRPVLGTPVEAANPPSGVVARTGQVAVTLGDVICVSRNDTGWTAASAVATTWTAA